MDSPEPVHMAFVWDVPSDEHAPGTAKMYLNGGLAAGGDERAVETDRKWFNHHSECLQALALGGTATKHGSGLLEVYRFTLFTSAKTDLEVKALYEETKPPVYNTEIAQ